MDTADHVVLGAGAVGMAVAEALVRRGASVRVVNRSGLREPMAGVQSVAGDVTDPAFARSATQGARVVYQALNPPYHRWAQEFPGLQAAAIAAAQAAGARLVVMDNVYMYGHADGRPFTEDRAYEAHTRKGRVRAAMARDLMAARDAGRVQVTVGRASDFFGPRAGEQSLIGDWVIPPALADKAASVMGDPDMPHTYSFVPDIGENLVRLGERDDALGRVWHLPSPETRTTREVVGLVYQAAGTRPRLKVTPAWQMRALGLVNRTVREIDEMRYEFEEPFVVDASRAETELGLRATPLAHAVDDTVRWYRAAGERVVRRRPQTRRAGRARMTDTTTTAAAAATLSGARGPTMRAIVRDRYGAADVLRVEQVDRPTITDDQVLVRVHAAGLERGAWHIMAGLPYLIRVAGYGLRTPRNAGLGSELAGVVEAVGASVTQLRPGEAVFGTCGASFAEYAAARPDKLSRMPANLSFEQAAAVPVSAVTALQALRERGRVRAGQRVLIIGASGGVGTFAVQIAKALGAHVTGVAGTTKLDLVRSLGADHVIDYTRADVTDDGQRYELILDIGGNRPLTRLRRALTRDGTLVIVGGEGGGRWTGGIHRQLGATVLSLFVRQRLGTFIAKPNSTDLDALRALIEAGSVTPAIDRVIALQQVPDAMRDLTDGHVRGKLIMRVTRSSVESSATPASWASA
jgi:NADPH:quinone reductase-like Zn-dependent oxidoreductase/nucleoside-diphosphate-sugar epimerase